MPNTRRLLREEITYSDAKKREVNILHQLSYYDRQNEFFSRLNAERCWMKAVVAHHLGLRSSNACQVAEVEDWLHGSFNVCIPVTIMDWNRKKQPGQRVLLRLPLPYRVGEAFRPGNGDEKIRCEAGTYAWLQENCPDVPIPRLYGFAMSTGETFTQIENLPLLSRILQRLRRLVLSCLTGSVPSCYVRHQPRSPKPNENGMGSGYMLIEYIEETAGKMLSTTWLEKHNDTKLRRNFFRDLSRILLSVTRVPLPRIGSFIIDNNGYLHLTNRPLSLEVQDLENERIPTDLPRDRTYSTADSYVTDILGFHDSRLRNQPNAINDIGDFIYQVSALTAMRTVFPSFFRQNLRHGPFVLSFTDLNQSNIFVDENWHITCLVDLEWVCSRSIEMVRTPTWLTNKAVDEIAEESDDYYRIWAEFLDVLSTEEEEHNNTAVAEHSGRMPLSVIMKQSWETGTFWYSLALDSPTGLFAVFYKQIQPRFLRNCPENDAFEQAMPWYWEENVVSTLKRKLSDKKDYDDQLRQAFQ